MSAAPQHLRAFVSTCSALASQANGFNRCHTPSATGATVGGCYRHFVPITIHPAECCCSEERPAAAAAAAGSSGQQEGAVPGVQQQQQDEVMPDAVHPS